MEFMKNGDGRVIPGAIPVVYFTTEERLNEMIDFCRSIGVFVANPHVNYLEEAADSAPTTCSCSPSFATIPKAS